MPRDLEMLAERVLAAAKAAGAETADVVSDDGTSLSIDLRSGALEQAERAEGLDIGLRAMIGRRQACVSVSNDSDRVLAEMAERAVAMAREAPEDPSVGLADAADLARDVDSTVLDLADPAPEPLPADLEAAAREAEAAALGYDGIAMVDTASAGYSARRIRLATSGGFSAGYTRTDSSLYCVAITGAGTGMERDYFGESRVYRSDLPGAEEVGRIAAERTLARAGASKPPTGAYPVLFDERVAASLVGHLVSAINGTAVVRGASWLRDALGEAVLPKGMSLIEQPHRARTAASRLFDGEGLATAERALVDDGVLQGWVLDLSTGRRLGLRSTANAARGTTAPPSPSVTNLMLTQGPHTRAELMAEMGTGLLVTSMIGATINPTTGDYSRGASGFWVENGEIVRPVNECTIAGNLRDMLRTLRPANDARTYTTRVVPSLLVEGLTLAGA